MPVLSRRHALLGSAGLFAAPFMAREVLAQPAAQPPTGPFTLAPLPYAPEANEPHIDAQTMSLHHGRHHAAAVAGLNAAVKDHSQIGAMKINDILAKLADMPEAVRTAIRNNAGSHANHTMFWQVMGGKGGAPTGDLAAAITRDLGGLDKMKADFNRAGLTQFGSGWAFITVDRDGKLAILNRPNQDTPLMEGRRVLLGNDVWEHAYYLKYNNRRGDYLTSWWNVVNWDKVAERFAAARAGTLEV